MRAIPLAARAPQGCVASGHARPLPCAAWPRRALVPRPCSGRRRASGHREKRPERTARALPANPGREERAMSAHDAELEQLRAGVNCATLLERLSTGWTLDR